MANNTPINLILYKGTHTYDISQFVQQIKWSGRKGSSARKLDVTLLDDDERSSRVYIELLKGNQCIFNYRKKELFRGIIMSKGDSSKKQLTFRAYDNCIYLANNKDSFSYTNKTLPEIFKDICKRFGLPYSKCAASNYKIPELTKPNTTAWDVLCDAMSIVYKATGKRFYIMSQKGSLQLIARQENIMQWVVEPGANLISYTANESIEKVRTRIKLTSNENKTLAIKKNTSLEKAIGIMQEIDKPDEGLNSAQLDELVTNMMKEKGTPESSLRTEILGHTDAVSGIGMFVIIPALALSKTYYIDEDNHTFSGNLHKMTLTFNAANDSEYDKTISTSIKK